MEDIERFKLLSRVFRQLPDKFGGMTVHPLTAGRWDLLRERENRFLFSGEDPQEKPPVRSDFDDDTAFHVELSEWEKRQSAIDGEMMFAICEFLWVHTAPVGEVLAVDSDPAAWKREVKTFALEHADMAQIIEYMMIFREKAQQLAAAMVEPIEGEEAEDDDGPGKDRRSPTGSPATSSPSADTSPPSGGDTSCGNSISTKGSSTSIAPTVDPGRTASGPGEPQPTVRPTMEGMPPLPSAPCGSDG